jgi:hypothetical protein
MYKKVEDIFSSVDGNRTVAQPQVQPKSQTVPQKSYESMTEAEKIRAMGDRLSAIWGSK